MAKNLDNRIVLKKDYMRAPMKKHQMAKKIIEMRGLIIVVSKDY